MSIYDEFGVPTVINAVGYATRVAGSCPHETVIAAMAEASRAYVEIDALEAAASGFRLRLAPLGHEASGAVRVLMRSACGRRSLSDAPQLGDWRRDPPADWCTVGSSMVSA